MRSQIVNKKKAAEDDLHFCGFPIVLTLIFRYCLKKENVYTDPPRLLARRV